MSARHKTTLEVTRDDYLTPQGDCIVAIDADIAPIDFPREVKEMARDPQTRIRLTIQAGEHRETITGRGDPGLQYTDHSDMVARTSTYTDGRTLMVEADKAAHDLDRGLVEELQGGGPVRIILVFTRSGSTP